MEVEQTELDKPSRRSTRSGKQLEERDILSLNNKKKTEEDIATEEGVQKKACKKLGETIKRKGGGEGSSEPKKKRWSRKGGNDIIELQREKANIDMTIKQEEHESEKEGA